ncbi:COBRA-like protein 2, partial [Linum perenne]
NFQFATITFPSDDNSLCADCFDPLDPNGNITVTFDVIDYPENGGYVARVTINNFYQYRHIEKPGWQIGWGWGNGEIILKMEGAYATDSGDCKNFAAQKPHCCKQNPVIADLWPGASTQGNNFQGCCKGGVISAWAIDPSLSSSAFQITVGNLPPNTSHPPANLTLFVPALGYTCGPVQDSDPTVFLDYGGRRKIRAFRTMKSVCTYSSFLANRAPTCCVSLSTFYNPQITDCPKCSCGCRDSASDGISCSRYSILGVVFLHENLDQTSDVDKLQCTDHMCPVRVHWHVKNSYIKYWRVKLTISNYNLQKNYSDWNAVIQHPGFRKKAIAYSFNSTTLPTVGIEDEVALFWGLAYYNSELTTANDFGLGSVTTDIILEKDSDTFTLSNGWALPRRVFFGGEECQMPLPDSYPTLPNGATSSPSLVRQNRLLFLLLLLLLMVLSELRPWLIL